MFLRAKPLHQKLMGEGESGENVSLLPWYLAAWMNPSAANKMWKNN